MSQQLSKYKIDRHQLICRPRSSERQHELCQH
jgi:hypothetical protein